MPDWKQLRYRPARVLYADEDAEYDLVRAKEAHSKMAELGVNVLLESLWTPGRSCEIPYPGVGIPPRRPGGDIKFTGRSQFRDLVETFNYACRGRCSGKLVYVTGPQGMGKSCYLRALSWVLILAGEEKKRRIICLWSLAALVQDFLGEVKSALSFTYCLVDDVLQDIDRLASLTDVLAFLDHRRNLGETLFFIVDGTEVLDATKGLVRPKTHVLTVVSKVLDALIMKAPVSIIAADMISRKRKADGNWVHFEQGFWMQEYETFLKEASLLGHLISLVPDRQEEIDYYAGQHPLSLSLLDAACKLQAQKTSKPHLSAMPFEVEIPDPKGSNEEFAKQLQDQEEWDGAVNHFVSSAEISSVRTSLAETLSQLELSSPCHTQESMMSLDRRFVIGDPSIEVADYVSPYIKRIYIEGFRDAESGSVFSGGAWEPYCRYLLDHGGPINWAEMGWLCENLAAEVISRKGLTLDAMSIRKARTRRFAGVPGYSTWIADLEDGQAVYFVPLKYNYRSIDGILLWRDASRVFHLFAIQVTVNDESHQRSATEFMSLSSVSDWIPEEHLGQWRLHFVFLCRRSLPTKVVQSDLKPLRSGGNYGTVAYSLHTVAFQCAFESRVQKTLEDVAKKREEASEPAAQKQASDEVAAIAAAAAAQGSPASPEAAAAIRSILSRGFNKQQLINIANHHNVSISPDDTKPVLISKIASCVLAL